MNQRRYITWFRNGPFDLGAQYSHNSQKIGNYQIQLEPQTEKKKIKIEAKMSIHGIFSVDSAHIVEIEEYEEVVKEKREIVEPEPSASPEADGDVPMPDANGAEKQGENGAESSDKKESETTSAEGGDGKKEEAAPEKKEEKKEETKKPKYEWVEVKKPKKRTKRIGLSVVLLSVYLFHFVLI